jgi:translation initiation factor IF-1
MTKSKKTEKSTSKSKKQKSQKKKSKEVIETEGVVTDCLPNALFNVKIEVDGKEHEVLGHLSGKMRMNYVKVLQGDKVKVEISPYDTSKARIVYRYKRNKTFNKNK